MNFLTHTIYSDASSATGCGFRPAPSPRRGRSPVRPVRRRARPARRLRPASCASASARPSAATLRRRVSIVDSLDRRARAALRLLLRRRVADGDRHVRHALAFERGATLRARIQPARVRAARTAVDRDLRDKEIGRGPCCGCSRRSRLRCLQQFLDRFRREHARELQEHERFANGLAANRIGDATQLARPHPSEFQMGERLRALGRLRVFHPISPSSFLGPSGP